MSESAKRTLRILKTMRGKTLQGMTVSEIAQSIKETSTNVCRGLDDLIAEGLVSKLETGRYAHTVQLLQIANAHAQETERSKARLVEMEQRVTRNHG